ncbi:N-acetylmuramoyl-L-alanine amidase [Bacillus massiliigorillae]|uniref:N-acetylmuramoyl-L-alanine amidase n=1 Tax=Bacillus massiliigorillae TaxID=1243664 RepID=UPI00039F256F|nr:N-acetylmuramoyl-L-alanine amidase [Bacillus massiliigorillae]
MKSVVISSGHGKYVSGARGYIDEVTEARNVVVRVATYLKQLDVETYEFHDNTSKSQNENLKTIVKYHNSKQRDLDVSVHFNSGNTEEGGVEVYYYDDSSLAAKVSKAIGDATGMKNRGAKQNKELYVLKNTSKPAILIEVCFVNVKSNTDAYGKHFDAVCKTIAETLANKKLANSSANQPTNNKRYRLYTGTFATEASAKAFKEKVEKTFDVTLQMREE